MARRAKPPKRANQHYVSSNGTRTTIKHGPRGRAIPVTDRVCPVCRRRV